MQEQLMTMLTTFNSQFRFIERRFCRSYLKLFRKYFTSESSK